MDSDKKIMKESSKDLWEQKFKINEDYVLREICGDFVLIPAGDTEAFSNSMISLNDSFVFLWKQFSDAVTPEEVLKKVMAEYDGPEDQIRNDVAQFVLESLRLGFLKEEK